MSTSDFTLQPQFLQASINLLVQQCFGASEKAGWWTDLQTGLSTRDANNVPEKLMLTVSELSEAMEGHRTNKADTHLPEFKMIEVELADAIIRICGLAGAKGYRLSEALAAKMVYNAEREDPKIENRRKADGKKY